MLGESCASEHGPWSDFVMRPVHLFSRDDLTEGAGQNVLDPIDIVDTSCNQSEMSDAGRDISHDKTLISPRRAALVPG